MKTESVAEFLKRGGKITKLEEGEKEPILTADLLEKAQCSFYEQATDYIEENGFGNDYSEMLSIDRVLLSNERKKTKSYW